MVRSPVTLSIVTAKLPWAGLGYTLTGSTPPHWAEYTFRAAADLGISGWLKVTVRGLVRAACALAVREIVVIIGTWARATLERHSNAVSKV
jgi:hypothetical protein